MGLIIDSPLKQIRRLGWLKRLEFIPLPVWITWQFIKTYKNQTFFCKWPSWFALYTPVKNWFRHMRQNISFLDIWCQYDIRTHPCWKKIGFTVCQEFLVTICLPHSNQTFQFHWFMLSIGVCSLWYGCEIYNTNCLHI